MGQFTWSRLLVGPLSSTVTVHDGRCPCCAGRAGSLFRRCAELLNTVADDPVVQVEQVHFTVVMLRQIPMVRPVWRAIEISQLQYAPGGLFLLCGSSKFREPCSG